jgi:hypothetical protein
LSLSLSLSFIVWPIRIPFIHLGSITLLRLHLVDIHIHDSVSTFAPSRTRLFRIITQQISTAISFFFLPDTAKHLYHTFTPLIHPNFYRYTTFVESRLHTRICEKHTHYITPSFIPGIKKAQLHDDQPQQDLKTC